MTIIKSAVYEIDQNNDETDRLKRKLVELLPSYKVGNPINLWDVEQDLVQAINEQKGIDSLVSIQKDNLSIAMPDIIGLFKRKLNRKPNQIRAPFFITIVMTGAGCFHQTRSTARNQIIPMHPDISCQLKNLPINFSIHLHPRRPKNRHPKIMLHQLALQNERFRLRKLHNFKFRDFFLECFFIFHRDI